MIDFRRAPVVRALIPFACGSLAGYLGFIKMDPLLLLACCFVAWLAALYLYRFPGRWRPLPRGLFCLSVLALFFMTGLGTGGIDKPSDPGIPTGATVVVKGRLREEPVMRNGRLVFNLDIRVAFTNDSIFLIRNLLKTYMEVSPGLHQPEVGETWLLCGTIVPVRNAGNPGEVDYASILKRKNCWYRFYCDTSGGINRMLEDHEPRIPGPVEVRRILSGYWEGSPATKALLKAVCLGDRSGLSDELRESYSMAGGMHVLAVSGLHIGLIWWVLNRLLSFIVLIGRKEIYKVILITLILWYFAYITGFSSSVSRAVSMFTLYSLSRMMNHRAHSVNAILVSMFILILVHPGWLMDVGFQLSYAAILSIVTLNPVFTRLWRPGNRLIRWVWEATGLSLSAQLGTFPLVIFYFHQVPLYALITNLFAIPLLSIIIALFVLSAPLVVCGLGEGITSSLLMWTGGVMNRLIELVASIPGAVLGGLFTDRFTTFSLLILIFLLVLFLNARKRACAFLFASLFCILLAWSAGNRCIQKNSAALYISHFKGGSLITIKEGLKLDHYILADDPVTVAYMDRYLSSAWGRRWYEVSVVRLNALLPGRAESGGVSTALRTSYRTWMVGNNSKRGLIYAGPSGRGEPELPEGFEPDFVLLSGEPSLGQADELSISGLLVSDGSNRGWYTKKLRETGFRFHDTSVRGAFYMPVKKR